MVIKEYLFKFITEGTPHFVVVQSRSRSSAEERPRTHFRR